MRLKNYFKNLIIFFPIIFSGEILNFGPIIFINLFIVTISFSLLTSVIYIINDYFDQEDDSLHPIKKYRPLASKKLSNRNVFFLYLIIFIIEILLYINFEILKQFRLLFFIYFINNIFYNLVFKKVNSTVASLSISFGFYLRLIIGSEFSEFDLSFTLSSLVFLSSFLTSYLKKINDNSLRDLKKTKFLSQKVFIVIALIIILIYIIHLYSYNLLEFQFLIVLNLVIYLFCIFKVYNFFIVHTGPKDPIDLIGFNIESILFIFWLITYFEIRFLIF